MLGKQQHPVRRMKIQNFNLKMKSNVRRPEKTFPLATFLEPHGGAHLFLDRLSFSISVRGVTVPVDSNTRSSL